MSPPLTYSVPAVCSLSLHTGSVRLGSPAGRPATDDPQALVVSGGLTPEATFKIARTFAESAEVGR